jgi:prepilin-type N-terminal cleavage/methylation domain-containing protein
VFVKSNTKRRRVASGRRGFTIVEVVVAMLILTIGVLGLAGTAASVTRMMGSSEIQSDATNVALSRFEVLRGGRCPVVSGSNTSAGITERWTVLGAVGAANLNLYDVVDTVSFRTTSGSRPQGYRSVVQCQP